MCNTTCECSLIKVVSIQIGSNEYEPIYEVDCSGKNLTAMPENIPKYTRVLHLEDNRITNVAPLRYHPYYRNIWQLHLDNNQIYSIEILEGSYWLSHFRLLSLRGNKLRKVRQY